MTPEEQETIQYYNKHAQEWAAEHNDPDFWQPYLDKFCAALRPGARILEVGSGSGMAARHFIDRGFGYLGTDVSPGMIQVAQENVPDGAFTCMHPEQMGTGLYRRWEAWWATASLLHVPHERLSRTLGCIAGETIPGALGFMTLRAHPETHDLTEPETGRTFYLWKEDDLRSAVPSCLEITEFSTMRANKDITHISRNWSWACVTFRTLT